MTKGLDKIKSQRGGVWGDRGWQHYKKMLPGRQDQECWGGSEVANLKFKWRGKCRSLQGDEGINHDAAWKNRVPGRGKDLGMSTAR